ncbi:MAG TPA: trehalase family glycosidase [Candidatus Saccharimonadales bacterium]|nr:trehalase family glycosidase [Candidatus Saccharimonadales bacterium]
MIQTTRNIVRKFWPSHSELNSTDVAPARGYIDAYWQKLQRYHPKDDESLLGLPKPYLVPAFEEGHEFDFNELYYWDSYFMVQGFLDEQHKELVMGILENLTTLFKRFRVVPNASRTYLTGRSQPPFLTTFIWDLYTAFKLDEKWLGEHMAVAEKEYATVWMGTFKPNARQVYRGLSRYYDINLINDLAEAESGWDMTPRFGRRALNYTPVDLNALLFKYEMDFARYYRLIDDVRSAAKWEVAADFRRTTMDELMWNNLRGLYYDYNYVKEKRGTVSSLAGFYPLWAGMVSPERAEQMVKALRRFENRGGLATTDVQQLGIVVPGSMPTQWAHPNGWAPLQFLVVKGLERYGYHADAKRIAMKWLKTNVNWFNSHGVFLEKYNVVNPDKPPAKGLYPSQTGFGWTNAVFEYLCRTYIDNNKPPDIDKPADIS